MGDDTIAVQKMCDHKESVLLHRREKKLVVMLAADGRYGLRCCMLCACVCVCVCVCMCVCVSVWTLCISCISL